MDIVETRSYLVIMALFFFFYKFAVWPFSVTFLLFIEPYSSEHYMVLRHTCNDGYDNKLFYINTYNTFSNSRPIYIIYPSRANFNNIYHVRASDVSKS